MLQDELNEIMEIRNRMATQDKSVPLKITTQDKSAPPKMTTQDHDGKKGLILKFCEEPHTKKEIMEHVGLKNLKSFEKLYIRPLLENDQLEMTIKEKPTSRNQRYTVIKKGKN